MHASGNSRHSFLTRASRLVVTLSIASLGIAVLAANLGQPEDRVAGAQGDQPRPVGRHSHSIPLSEFWQSIVGGYEAMEAEHYTTLEELSAASDAVVMARVDSVVPGRIATSALGPGVVHHALIELVIEEILHGAVTTAADRVLLEALVSSPESVLKLQQTLPSQAGLYFLRERADEASLIMQGERGAPLYRVVVLQGIMAEDEEGKVYFPAYPSDGGHVGEIYESLSGAEFAAVRATVGRSTEREARS